MVRASSIVAPVAVSVVSLDPFEGDRLVLLQEINLYEMLSREHQGLRGRIGKLPECVHKLFYLWGIQGRRVRHHLKEKNKRMIERWLLFCIAGDVQDSKMVTNRNIVTENSMLLSTTLNSPLFDRSLKSLRGQNTVLKARYITKHDNINFSVKYRPIGSTWSR